MHSCSCFLLCAAVLFTLHQNSNAAPEIQYISPLDNSEWQSCESVIIAGFNGPAPLIIDASITGSISGEVSSRTYRPSNGNRLVFIPEEPFTNGEHISVKLFWPGGRKEWTFDVRPFEPSSEYIITEEIPMDDHTASFPLEPSYDSGVSVPPDFPSLVLNTTGQPEPGYYFLGSISAADATNSSYLIICDEFGIPVFYWHWNKGIFCVKVQPTDLLTFGTRLPGNVITWLAMDDSYTLQDSFTVTGYQTDIHDFTMLENGHSLLLGTDTRAIDMSAIVPGGNPNANVTGLVIQEQDENHVTVFQWNSFDYIEITDAAHFVDLTALNIDYTHANSLTEDADGNILVSCLALCQCIKIDRSTGDLIWRLGGLDADFSDFILQGDPLGGFSSQHSFASSGTNKYTIYDNGRFHNPQESRALEYELNTQNMTATLVWSHAVSGLYGTHFGSVQKLPGGNYVIGSGDVQGTTTFADVTEVNFQGTQSHALRFIDPVIESYMAYKYDWEGQALVPYLVVQKNSTSTAAILSYNVFGTVEYDEYRIWQGTSPESLSPILLTPDRQATVWELPTGWNYFAVTALNSSGETGPSNIDSVLVNWTGTSWENAGVLAPGIMVSPNPVVSGSAGVSFCLTRSEPVTVNLIDLAGRTVLLKEIEASGNCEFSGVLDVSSLPAGLYTVHVSGESEDFFARVVLLRGR